MGQRTGHGHHSWTTHGRYPLPPHLAFVSSETGVVSWTRQHPARSIARQTPASDFVPCDSYLPRPRLRHRLRHLQFHRWLAAATGPNAAVAGRWQANPALRGLLQRRGGYGQLRPCRLERVPGGHRGAADAIVEKPARQQPDRRPHRGSRASGCLPRPAHAVHRHAQGACRN